ncbi:hypothetical protein IVA80_16585 [Bradyrhizobium sp. 139]|uniref:hypothetical protein n=1 Tax=Bradyrhizobium sp. 139 TaxID=2782616 RepID=UPI001FF986FA|nr:hypothetical protein [Bradyrhizobium sp. 139]MCK1742436.1 hypothetical protein [Bradyrhizobium sp. 139]
MEIQNAGAIVIVRVVGGLLLFVSLFSIVAPPRFLGSNGRKKAIAAALIGCALLIATDQGSKLPAKEAMAVERAVATPSQPPPLSRAPVQSSPEEPKMPTEDIARALASGLGVAETSLDRSCSDLTDATICNFYPELVDLKFRLEGANMTMGVISRSLTADENGPLPQGNFERTSRIKAFVKGAIFLVRAAKPNLTDAECADFLKTAIERTTKHSSIKEAAWLDNSPRSYLRFKLTRENEVLKFEVQMKLNPGAFWQRPISLDSAMLVAAIDASFPDQIQAFDGGKALFREIKTEGNVICADDSPALMVADVNGQYIALNGTTRSWSEKGLRVLRGGKWHTVIDPGPTNFGEVNRMIDVALRLCPAPDGIEEGYRRVLRAEQTRKVLGSKFGLD